MDKHILGILHYCTQFDLTSLSSISAFIIEVIIQATVSVAPQESGFLGDGGTQDLGNLSVYSPGDVNT